MGPEPMRRMRFRSVRLGMPGTLARGAGAQCACSGEHYGSERLRARATALAYSALARATSPDIFFDGVLPLLTMGAGIRIKFATAGRSILGGRYVRATSEQRTSLLLSCGSH